jgi:hypothetical protein
MCACFITVMVFLLNGCESYVAPSSGAKMNRLFVAKDKTSYLIEQGQADTGTKSTIDIEIKDREPMAKFPANIVYVRVQESGYRSYTNVGYGSGNYSVITLCDIEEEKDFEQLGKLSGISQISRVSKLLLPTHYESDKELRSAASRLNADMLLIYTVDTTFFDINQSTALAFISIGLFPTNDVHIISTVSAVLMDTKTGYIYGTIDKSVKEKITTGALSTRNEVDKKRLTIERQAFEKFLDEFETTWPKIVNEYKK